MGTRNLTIVKADEVTRVAQYCQWDGYPSGQGATVLDFLHKANLEKFKEKVEKLHFLSDREIEQKWKERKVGTGIIKKIWCNQRNGQALPIDIQNEWGKNKYSNCCRNIYNKFTDIC